MNAFFERWQSRDCGLKPAFVGVLLGIFFCGVALSFVGVDGTPWVDEIGTSDTAANCVLKGRWYSHIWPYSYNPLHIHLLRAWFYVFGVNHFAACSLEIVTGFFVFLILQRVLIRAGLLETILQNVCYSFLFWGGGNFLKIMALARIDLLVALFSVLVVGELLPECKTRHSNVKIFVYSFFLMLAGVYTVPIIASLGLLLFAMAESNKERKELFVKGVLMSAGIFLAFAVSCLYYIYHGHLFRFVHTYFSFNGTMAGTGIPFANRVIDGYLFDTYGLILLVAASALLVALRECRRRLYFYILFVACIPVLGVIGGRYVSYYSWQFYLPVVCCVLFALSKLRGMVSRVVVVIAIGMIALYNNVRHCQNNLASRDKARKARQFVEAHPDIFCPGSRIMILDYDFYYPVVRSGAEVWCRIGTGDNNDISPREKFNLLVKRSVKNKRIREYLCRAFERLEKHPETLCGAHYECRHDANGVPLVSAVK